MAELPTAHARVPSFGRWLIPLVLIGFDPIVKDTAATVDYFKSEIANWGKMVKALGLEIK